MKQINYLKIMKDAVHESKRMDEAASIKFKRY